MSYAAKAALSILAGIAAAVAVLALGGPPVDIVGCTIVAAALVVFIRAVMSLASESSERPPPSGTGR
jgi:membrane protein implicated in regulation of membrane protease activity